ncbi:MAG: symmetrical bis(5'-nucleosyl)-tetraphosphatase [SAR86 cluster bacterium]|nr:symmetrical bis(5'-nucleosyl)-tetraphosphatase [SAR86 cluster bacterium]
MANYAIGDIQGCYNEFSSILELISFDTSTDKLWLTGDLVNVGPNSLECLDLIYSIKNNCNIVLGNHDLHLLAILEEVRQMRKEDTLEQILKTDKKNLYIDWISKIPLVHVEPLETSIGQREFIMSHAGIPPHWDLDEALNASLSIEKMLKNSKDRKLYLSCIFSNLPPKEYPEISYLEILRLNTNYLTRMRFFSEENGLNLTCKGPANDSPRGFLPWFKHNLKILKGNRHILFGHWSSLKGKIDKKNISALDTGCVWGNPLKALRLEDGREFNSNVVN